MWSYQEHQVKGAEWALDTIRQYGLAYLGWKERTRKTGTAILTVENSKAKSCLIITKKNAIDGWRKHFKNLLTLKDYTIVNYESVHTRTKNKAGKLIYTVKPEYLTQDFIILDESHHAISSIGRPSTTWKSIRKITIGKPILYLSATPYAEHVGLIFHQLHLSDWTPLKFRNFYQFHKRYGIPDLRNTPYGLKEQYGKYKKDEVLKLIGHLFDWKTRAEVGIEHEPTVNLVIVPMEETTATLMKEWKRDKYISIAGHDILGDSDAKVRSVHYQLEGGTLKIDDELTIRTGLNEKIDYIKDSYNLNDIAIMAHFIEERELLHKELPSVPIYSSDGHAEGVDLSHIKKLLIYSMSFKTSKHTQRVARQANHDREEPIIVDVLVMDKPAIGKAIYNTVAIKMKNFIADSYDRMW